MEITQKRNFYSNFDFFMKKLNLKKTDLEKEAGVSQGYLSRFIQKEDPDAFPSVSFLEYCSRKFEVPMDDLLNTKFEEMSLTEEYIYQFLKKLTLETTSDDLLWTETDQFKIYEYIRSDYKEPNGSIWNDFISEPSSDFDRLSYEPDAVDIVFKPAREFRRNSILHGSIFYTRIEEEHQCDLFLIPIQYPSIFDSSYCIEITLWMGLGDGYQRKLRCIARGGEKDFSLLYPILKRLLDTVKERQKHIQIENGFRCAIRWYLDSGKTDTANQNAE